MDAANFELEFMQLLVRYTTPIKTTNEKTEDKDISKLSSGTSLSLETINQIVQKTLSTIIPESYVSNISCNKTPGNDIIISTPDAPYVERVIVNEDGIIRECSDNLSDKLSSICKKNTSPPKFNLMNTSKTDIFVQDDETENLPDHVCLKLNALRKCAVEVISKIDELKTVNKDCIQSPMEKTIRPNRRLSSIGNFSLAVRSKMIKSDQQQSFKKERSFSNFSNTTPTSSRLNSTITLRPNLSKKKSSSSIALNVTTTSNKSSASTNSNLRSRSSLPSTGLKKSSSNNSRLSPGTIPKNPKYAHIQSSIPKPMSIVKKN